MVEDFLPSNDWPVGINGGIMKNKEQVTGMTWYPPQKIWVLMTADEDSGFHYLWHWDPELLKLKRKRAPLSLSLSPSQSGEGGFNWEHFHCMFLCVLLALPQLNSLRRGAIF